ncbi:hypothetical protein HMPREF6485_0823 [Segatella buccae ATCC 33574]|uniref:Uncharacterized protein n=1 Tax=Segatella buccae ATCC 33574 TaxID=873513 RepID=E6K5I3_9BACT|nr:hypothetical protein HMPREF6485_0823 [Segatella buccae ATCC 33574]
MLFRPNKEYKEWNNLNYMGGGREGQMLGKEKEIRLLETSGMRMFPRAVCDDVGAVYSLPP